MRAESMGQKCSEQEILFSDVEKTLQELIHAQEDRLFSLGKRFVPHLTKEDLLQPNDFDELEHNPHFRYEEGVLSGLLTVQMAFLAMRKERLNSF